MTPEQMLIATCLAYPDAVTLTRGRADAEDFIDPRYQHLYTAILTEYAEAGTVNPITVHQRATTAGLRGVDLVDLYRWQEAISSAAVAPTLADQVRDGALRYRLGLMVGQMHQRISDTSAPVADSVSEMLAALTQIRDGATGGSTNADLSQPRGLPQPLVAGEDQPVPTLEQSGDDPILGLILGGKDLAERLSGQGGAAGRPVPDLRERGQHLGHRVSDGGTGGTTLAAKTLREILETEDEPEDWVIPGLFERGDRLILTGYEGLGKTTWLRQIGICAAAGLNPVTLDQLDRQIRVLFVDVENSERQWRRETRGIAVVAERGGLGSPRDYVHVHTGARMDLRKDRDLGLVHRLVDQYQPEILVIGPLYRLTPNGINNDEEAAPLIAALDTLRDRGLVLAMEAHAPKGSMGERNLAPRGSAALMGWPEFGFGLAPQDKDETGKIQTAEVVRWRGDRDRGRQWPKMLWAGGPFPWTADEVSNSTRQALYAR